MSIVKGQRESALMIVNPVGTDVAFRLHHPSGAGNQGRYVKCSIACALNTLWLKRLSLVTCAHRCGSLASWHDSFEQTECPTARPILLIGVAVARKGLWRRVLSRARRNVYVVPADLNELISLLVNDPRPQESPQVVLQQN